MGNKESKEEVNEEPHVKKMKEYAKDGKLNMLQKYISDNLEQWKNETVSLGITGKSASGKSTFINTFRGVTPKDKTYAQSGLGNTTLTPTPYPCPTNHRVVLWDLPGIGTTQFKRESYLEDVVLKKYDVFTIFTEKALTEDDVWLAKELSNMKKPFCFVRSKIDHDIDNAEFDGTTKDAVIPSVRSQLLHELEQSCPFLKERIELFIISGRKKFGDWYELVNYIQLNLPKAKFEALLYSLPEITRSVIEKKKEVLLTRIKFVTVGAAMISAIPIPGLSVNANLAIVGNEIQHYINTFEMNNLEPSVKRTLKCREFLENEDDLTPIIKEKFTTHANLMMAGTIAPLVPIIGSVVALSATFPIVHSMLSDIIDMFVEDAYTIDANSRRL